MGITSRQNIAASIKRAWATRTWYAAVLRRPRLLTVFSRVRCGCWRVADDIFLHAWRDVVFYDSRGEHRRSASRIWPSYFQTRASRAGVSFDVTICATRTECWRVLASAMFACMGILDGHAHRYCAGMYVALRCLPPRRHRVRGA